MYYFFIYSYRDSWIWVFIKGGETLGEAFSPNLVPTYPEEVHQDSPRGIDETLSRIEKRLTSVNSFYEKAMDEILFRKISSSEFNQTSPNEIASYLSIESKKKNASIPKILEKIAEIQDPLLHPVASAPSHPTDFVKQERLEDSVYGYNYRALATLQNFSASPLNLDVRMPFQEDVVFLLFEYKLCPLWEQKIDNEPNSLNTNEGIKEGVEAYTYDSLGHKRRGTMFPIDFDLEGSERSDVFLQDEQSRWRARVRFCQTFDGYGSLCHCDNPFQMKKLNGTKNPFYEQDIPIIILAGNRTRSLFRLLERLNDMKGVYADNIWVVVDGSKHNENTLTLLYILGMRVLMHKPEGEKAVRISRNLRFALYNVMRETTGLKTNTTKNRNQTENYNIDGTKIDATLKNILTNSSNINNESLKKHRYKDSFILLEDDLILSKDFYR